MTKFERYVKFKEIEYKKFSVKKEIDINNFLSNFLVIEKMGQNGLINFEHNEANYRKDDYYWFMYNQKILENKIIEEKGYSTLFLTLTLPSSYHKFSKTTKRYNPKFDENNTIENGYKLLVTKLSTIFICCLRLTPISNISYFLILSRETISTFLKNSSLFRISLFFTNS